jgi:hypothetical protein
LQDANDGGVGGEDAESNLSDYGGEEKYGHKKRDHDRSNLIEVLPTLDRRPDS